MCRILRVFSAHKCNEHRFTIACFDFLVGYIVESRKFEVLGTKGFI